MAHGFTKNPSEKAEDAASASGDILTAVAAVRQDTLASSVGTDGDYAALKVDVDGRLWGSVKVDTALPAGTNNIGDVDVASIAAGDNNIGNVDVASTPTCTTATLTNVDISAGTNQTLFASNASAKGRFIVNDSTSVSLFVKFGTTASATDYTVKIEAQGFYEVPALPAFYTGRIDAIASAAGVAGDRARVTELT